MCVHYRKKYKACLFDMDGLLLNTEDLYTEAHNSMLADHGKGPLPWNEKIKLQGLPGLEASRVFLEWSNLPYTPEKYYEQVTSRLALLFPSSQFLPGARELLMYLKEHNIPIALATSSNSTTFKLKTDHHLENGFQLFGKHMVKGDDSRIPPGRGKPHPNIWQVALQSLNESLKESQGQNFVPIKPEECLVFEDSVQGVASGKAMGATVIWVPHKSALDVIGKDEAEKLIDGHGELLVSLEQFDRGKYFNTVLFGN